MAKIGERVGKTIHIHVTFKFDSAFVRRIKIVK
jgi:hypothetical protein